MKSFLADFRYGFRMLIKRPGFTFAAVLSLALGIGSSTAIFTVINGVLLKPLPYKESERLFLLWEKSAQMETSVSYPNFLDWQENHSFEGLSAHRLDNMNVSGLEQPERATVRMISHNFFPLLGVSFKQGRHFSSHEDRPGGDPVVILSHDFLKRHFAADQEVIGGFLKLDEKQYRIVGVAPEDFEFGSGGDLFVPIGQSYNQRWQRGNHPGIYVLGRLKNGVTIEQAEQNLQQIALRLQREYPDTNSGRTILMRSLREDVVGDVRPTLVLLFCAVSVLLLIACGNVANMLLARTSSRSTEIAIRSALGANRRRIARQLISESLLLTLLGGAVGVLFAVWGVQLLFFLQPDAIPRVTKPALDLRVLGFSLSVSVISALFFGILPAIYASRDDLQTTLKQKTGQPAGKTRMREAMIVTEFALALTLLIGSGLMIRSYGKLQEVDPGFNPGNLLILQLSLPELKYEGKQVLQFFHTLQERVESLQNVESMAFTNGLPLVDANEELVHVEGRPAAKPGEETTAVLFIASNRYFETMKIPLIQGRYFDRRENSQSPPVTIIDENFAKQFFPGENAVGRRLKLSPDFPGFEIIGVVKHVKHYGLATEGPVRAQYYLAFEQVPDVFLSRVAARMCLLVRTKTDRPLELAPAVKTALLSIDKDQPVFGVRTMQHIVNESIAGRRFSMFLVSIFAALSLLLAATGIYGLISYSVSLRVKEIGIRMALGATRFQVLKMVVNQGMYLILFGLLVGIAAGFGASRLLSSLLYETSASDVPTFFSVSIILVTVGLLACYFPAKKATKVDPITALRYE